MERLKDSLDFLIEGKLTSVVIEGAEEDDERVLFATAYLESKGYFYELQEGVFDDMIKITLVTDAEEIDCLREDVHMEVLFRGLDKNHKKLLKEIRNLEKFQFDSFDCFHALDFFDSIRFHLILDFIRNDFELEAYRDKGLIRVYKK